MTISDIISFDKNQSTYIMFKIHEHQNFPLVKRIIRCAGYKHWVSDPLNNSGYTDSLENIERATAMAIEIANGMEKASSFSGGSNIPYTFFENYEASEYAFKMVESFMASDTDVTRKELLQVLSELYESGWDIAPALGYLVKVLNQKLYDY